MSSVLRIFTHYARRNIYRNTKTQGIIVLCDDLVSLRRFGLSGGSEVVPIFSVRSPSARDRPNEPSRTISLVGSH